MLFYDTAVIGGGASGLAAAISSAEMNDKTIVLEAGNRCGRKILASGNGRCNILNTINKKYYGDSEFAENVLQKCDAEVQIRFWKKYGLFISVEENGCAYPFTHHSSSVLETLLTAAEMNKVDIRVNERVHSVKKTKDIFYIETNDNTYTARRVIVACGGFVQEKLGGSFSGYEILKGFGHYIEPVSPALTPIRTDSRSVSGLAGIRVRCRIAVVVNGNEVHSERGELLFTEYGISGICAMQCSRFVIPDKSFCSVDLADGLFTDNNSLISELHRRREVFGEMKPEYLLNGICLPKLSFAVCKQAGLSMRGERINDLTEENIMDIAKHLRNYRMKAIGSLDQSHAQVTAGGASCKEFLPDNMESRLISGLHATGEVLNVDGDCGGYNLMFAFGSGLLAGYNRRHDARYPFK